MTSKISVYETDATIVLKIEGRIAKPVIDELNRAWQDLAPSIGSRKLSIDLRGVTFMDRSGRQVLAEIHAKTGAEFLADTPMTKYFAEEAMQHIHSNSKQAR
jgi:anti-anti-sigma regulatory factor